jgi:hypothetical protein
MSASGAAEAAVSGKSSSPGGWLVNNVNGQNQAD